MSVLKAGSTFLRMLMTTPDSAKVLGVHDLSTLRLGTFCAEPVNEAVHRFAAEHLTPNYINSYWATEVCAVSIDALYTPLIEPSTRSSLPASCLPLPDRVRFGGVKNVQHGGIVWSRCDGNVDQPLRPDTRSWPLPWISGEVMLRDELSGDDAYKVAADGVQGEVVIRQRYPYQALTVWASAGFGQAEWRGDVQRWGNYFVPRTGYVQGDLAVRYTDGAFTFHGRSDEVSSADVLKNLTHACHWALPGLQSAVIFICVAGDQCWRQSHRHGGDRELAPCRCPAYRLAVAQCSCRRHARQYPGHRTMRLHYRPAQGNFRLLRRGTTA